MFNFKSFSRYVSKCLLQLISQALEIKLAKVIRKNLYLQFALEKIVKWMLKLVKHFIAELVFVFNFLVLVLHIARAAHHHHKSCKFIIETSYSISNSILFYYILMKRRHHLHLQLGIRYFNA